MTTQSIRERIVDSIVETLQQVGKDPNDGYWFEYNVDRYSVRGEQQIPPRIVVVTRGGSKIDDATGLMVANLSIDFLVELSHDLRRYPGLPPETETDRLIEYGVTDLERALLRWMAQDPLDVEPVFERFAWDRENPVDGRLEVGAFAFLELSYRHSAIDPRTRVYDPSELTS